MNFNDQREEVPIRSDKNEEVKITEQLLSPTNDESLQTIDIKLGEEKRSEEQ